MSVKETIHQWVDLIPEESSQLRDLFEQARLEMAIHEARQSVAAGRTVPIEEVMAAYEEKCRLRNSA